MAVLLMSRIGLMMVAKLKKTKFIFIFAMLFCNGCISEVNRKIPSDVNSFVESADACTHYSGEWDSSISKQKQQEIEKAVDKYCGLAKKQQIELEVKYKGNKSIEKELSNYTFD
ncbi:hypothetical protein RHD99_00050 [Buttiauxella selenatireducens]|uniref:Lipoprotein n=1 Tax=Buttiauxella selenatireducens TaxID=3073902 RepID=A0ABY9SBU9_9ENTR|nr:hypothetical protein [Buttiauxella sp. R73]WMY74423.1 hypothetical protein RHD99_00050 [Buttiauxella sp. R73]